MRFAEFVSRRDNLVIYCYCIRFDIDMILLPLDWTSTAQPKIGAVAVVGDKIIRMVIQLINSGLTDQHDVPTIIDVHDQGMWYLPVA